jgi:hypothetical protein
MSNCTNIHPLGAELFHADGQTDIMKLTVAFHNFAHKLSPWIMEQKTSYFYRMGTFCIHIFTITVTTLFNDSINTLNGSQNGDFIRIFQFSCSYIE